MSEKYQDKKIPITERIANLLAKMTLEEKVGQMMQLAALEKNHEEYIEKYHLGSYLHAVGDDIPRLQALNEERSRLKIPLIFGIDAIHGHCLEEGTTVFPVQLAMACTWNRELVTEMGKITAVEARAGGLHWTFSPVLCMGRDPRWGRTAETFGEDPFLLGELAWALTEGYQGADYPIAACSKHYAAYGEALGGRDSFDAHVSERQMRNVFLPPFERQAKGGCKTFMAGYLPLNGIPCSANTWLMNDILREEWQYEGVVVTDWDNAGQIFHRQLAAPSMKEAIAQTLEASNDVIMSTHDFYDYTLELIKEGRVKEARIEESVRRILKLKFELGLFDGCPVPDRQAVLSNTSRWETALTASQQSLTLVKNNGILPLNDAKRILLVGDNADSVLNQLGDWSFIPGMHAFNDDTLHRSDTVTLHQALNAYCQQKNIALEYLGAEYCGPETKGDVDYTHLTKAARRADVVLFCAGDSLKQYGEFHDRSDLQLNGNQQNVFDILIGSDTPIVSVMLMSKPHCMAEVLDNSQAVLIAFNPGAKGGTAITQCLFGDINPMGRLPISFPRNVGQLPVYYNQAPGWHASLSLHYDQKPRYIDLPETPLLAFGEGMSYSEITYSDAKLNGTMLNENTAVSLSLSLTNNSEREAVEVVQLYRRVCIPGVTTPTKQLIKFERVTLPSSQTVDLNLTITQTDFLIWDKPLSRIPYKGEAIVMVGKSSKDEDLQELKLSCN